MVTAGAGSHDRRERKQGPGAQPGRPDAGRGVRGSRRAWIAARPRITVTYTPKHASWLDMAELWFSVLTRALLRRGEFTSRADLIEKITGFTIRYNQTARPWKWAYDAHAEHARYRTRHSGQHPSAETATTQTLQQAA